MVATQQSTLVPKLTPVPGHNQFGVYVSTSAATSQDTVSTVQQLGAGWVRLNLATSD
jgi:hypothetical protein